MADLRGEQLKDSYQNVVTRGTGNKLENGNGVEFADLDDKASLSGASIQTKSTSKTDTFSESIGGRPAQSGDITGLTVAITPSATTSKVNVTGRVSLNIDPSGLFLHLYRNGSEIAQADLAGDRIRAHSSIRSQGDSGRQEEITFSFFDSPNTTSETTYSVRFSHSSNSASTIYINRSELDTDADNISRTTSTITAQEVAQ